MSVDNFTNSVDVWLFKWVLLPALLFGVLFMVINYFVYSVKCRDLCRSHGYSDGVYIPPYRFNEEKCLCRQVGDERLGQTTKLREFPLK